MIVNSRVITMIDTTENQVRHAMAMRLWISAVRRVIVLEAELVDG